MLEMLTPLLLGFLTISRAVGVPRSVKTVPKLTVSVEKESFTPGDESMSSRIHDIRIKPIMAKAVNSRERVFSIKR